MYTHMHKKDDEDTLTNALRLRPSDDFLLLATSAAAQCFDSRQAVRVIVLRESASLRIPSDPFLPMFPLMCRGVKGVIISKRWFDPTHTITER